MNKWEKQNHSKHIVFIMVIAHAAIAFWHHFHPWITKNMDLETISHFAIPNHKIVSKVNPMKLPKSILKSIKVDIWASVCPLGVPLDPRIIKMVSQVPKKEPQGLKNDSFR